MKYYAIYNNLTLELSKSQCKCLNAECKNIEIPENIYNNFNKYIYQSGEIILNPNYEEEQAQKEAERIAKLSLTKREVFLGLYQAKGVTPEQIKAQITDPMALIEFEYANDYYRGNPLIDSVGAVLGITPVQLDCFFESGGDPSCLIAEEITNDTESDTNEPNISI